MAAVAPDEDPPLPPPLQADATSAIARSMAPNRFDCVGCVRVLIDASEECSAEKYGMT